MIVTGTGRCGTRYTHEVLRAAGINAGHEKVFTYKVGLGVRQPEWGEYQADVSWFAVPRLVEQDCPSVLVVRHPIRVVQSMLELGWFAPGQRKIVLTTVEHFRPDVPKERTRPDACLALWLAWNLAALPHVQAVVRLEAADFERRLLDGLGIDASPDPDYLAEVRADWERMNTKQDKKVSHPPVDWSTFRPGLRHAALDLAERLGY